jgi:hypothetical protein
MPRSKNPKAIGDEITRLDDPGSPERSCCIHVICAKRTATNTANTRSDLE